jgi:hypothetical protein
MSRPLDYDGVTAFTALLTESPPRWQLCQTRGKRGRRLPNRDGRWAGSPPLAYKRLRKGQDRDHVTRWVINEHGR